MPASNATSRFSDRVENYVRYRPGYPMQVLRVLENDCGLTPGQVVADIASGTGIWTRNLLENGNHVFGVEPNAEMRQAGERLLASFPKFRSVAGTADATTLEDQGVEFVTAAQAAHWFDRERARREFARILKPAGWLVLLWNERLTDSTAFLREYEELLLTYGTDYAEVRQERTTDAVSEFFDPAPFRERVFGNAAGVRLCRARRAGCFRLRMRRDRGIRNMSRCSRNCVEFLTANAMQQSRKLRLQDARLLRATEVVHAARLCRLRLYFETYLPPRYCSPPVRGQCGLLVIRAQWTWSAAAQFSISALFRRRNTHRRSNSFCGCIKAVRTEFP